jgi:hypothetical protein
MREDLRSIFQYIFRSTPNLRQTTVIPFQNKRQVFFYFTV